MRLGLLIIVLMAANAVSAQAQPSGAYTTAQASLGASVYAQRCSVCHGANLQGKSGTPLTGPTFSQAYGSGTAAQLYDFLSRPRHGQTPRCAKSLRFKAFSDELGHGRTP
jgi:mono/diheme cytochrome c family protein